MPPELDPANQLFDAIYERALNARNPEGGLDWGVLSAFMDLEGLAPQLKLDVLEKAVLVERLVAKRQSELIEKKMREKGKPS